MDKVKSSWRERPGMMDWSKGHYRRRKLKKPNIYIYIYIYIEREREREREVWFWRVLHQTIINEECAIASWSKIFKLKRERERRA